MKRMSIIFLISTIGVLMVFNCAAEKVKYDLPSAQASDKPEWVGTNDAVGDTIFIVVDLPGNTLDDMAQSVQEAQSVLHNILAGEIEMTLHEYWINQQVNYSEEEKFQLLADLPITLEHMMNHVTIRDGWEAAGEVSILCALDYKKMAEEFEAGMHIQDQAILTDFRLRLDKLAK